jgi:putative spermidine/putrescine transport system substrate-binding protein
MSFKSTLVAHCAAIAAALGPMSLAMAQDQGQVVVASWGGTYQDALRQAIIKPFEKATGIKVIEATGPSMPKMRTMVNTGMPEWDVVDMEPADFHQMAAEGMLQKLDYTAMDRSVFANFEKDAVLPNGVGNFVYATVITFNTKQYTQGNGPKSWADVWDVRRFPGPRIFDAGNRIPAPEEAVLADGVTADKLYPLDLKRAYASFSRIKPSVVKWATASAMQPEALISGEAVIGSASLGRIQAAKEQGAPVDYVWNQAVTGFDYWAVLKGSRNVKNAQKFIEFASRPESQAAFVKLQVLGPLNKKALDLIPEARVKLLPTYPENMAKTIPVNASWWINKDASGKSHLESNNALWNEWMLQ